MLGHEDSSSCSGDIEEVPSTYVRFCWVVRKTDEGSWNSGRSHPSLSPCSGRVNTQPGHRGREKNIRWRLDTPNWHYRVYKSQNPMVEALVLPGTGGKKISFCSFQHHFSRSLTCLTWSIPVRSAELTMSSHHLLLTFSPGYEALFYFYTDKSCSGWQLQPRLTSPQERYP